MKILVVGCAWLALALYGAAAAAEGSVDAAAAAPDAGAPSGDASPDAAAPEASPPPPRPAQAADGERPGRPPALLQTEVRVDELCRHAAGRAGCRRSSGTLMSPMPAASQSVSVSDVVMSV